MAATFIEVSGVEVSKDYIIVEALDFEKLIMADDLYEDMEVPTVKYQFSREKAGEMKYLLRVLMSNKQTQGCKSLGAMLDKLIGQFIMLNSNFIVQA